MLQHLIIDRFEIGISFSSPAIINSRNWTEFYINYFSRHLSLYEDLKEDRKTGVSFAFNRLFNEDKIGKSMSWFRNDRDRFILFVASHQITKLLYFLRDISRFRGLLFASIQDKFVIDRLTSNDVLTRFYRVHNTNAYNRALFSFFFKHIRREKNGLLCSATRFVPTCHNFPIK